MSIKAFNPMVSVVMPLYNMEKYLDDGLVTIINQTIGLDNIQVIFMDDGSTDSTPEICKKYCERYPENIEYHYQENSGISCARNKGAQFAQGKYINFFDADDKWSLDAFENMVNFIEAHSDEIDMVAAHVAYFERQTGFKHYGDFRFKGDRIIDIEEEPEAIQLAVCSIIIKKEVMEELQFDERLRFAEDQPFVSRLVTLKGKYGALSSAIHYYRKHFENNSFQDTRRLSKIRFLEHPWLNIRELIDFSIKKYGEVLPYHKHVIMYDLSWVFITENATEILTAEEKERYLKKIHELLQYVDDEIILNQKNMKLRHKIYALKQKYNSELTGSLVYKDNMLYFNNIPLFNFNGKYCFLLKTCRKTLNGEIILEGTSNLSLIDSHLKLVLSENVKDYKIRIFNEKNRIKYSYDENIIYDGTAFEIVLTSIPDEGFCCLYESDFWGKIPLLAYTSKDFSKTNYLAGITVTNSRILPGGFDNLYSFPLKITGRNLTGINRNDEQDSIRDKCIKQMDFFNIIDSPEYRELTEEETAQLENFWKPYEFAYRPVSWQYNKIYTNCRKQFDARYIPEDLQKYYFSSYYMDDDYVKAFDDKNYYDLVLPMLNRPKTIVHKIDNAFFDCDMNSIDVTKAAKLCIKYRNSTGNKIGPVIKPSIRTSGGSGIIVVDKTMDVNEISYILGSFRENIIVQSFITQHKEMSKVHASSVNTLRVMSYLHKNECKILAGCMRMGQNNSLLDNAGLGGLSCRVSTEGICSSPLYDKKGHIYETHPQGFVPDGFIVPSYDKLVDTIKRTHAKFPQLKLISWDFAIDAQGDPVFIEWNMKGDTQILQFSNGPLWGDYTREILDDFFSNTGKTHSLMNVQYLELLDNVKVIGCNEGTSKVEILREINGKPVTEIVHRAFFNNNDITEVIMQDSIETIGYQAFLGCRNLSKIKLSNKLKVISDGCFTSCKSLISIMLPDSVSVIKMQAFSFCSNLSEIELPNSLKTLSYGTFKNCTKLKTVSLGLNVRKIENKAFENCRGLKEIIGLENLQVIERYAFRNCNKLFIEKSRLNNIKLGYKAIPSMESKGKASLPKKNKKKSLFNRLIKKVKSH